MIKFQACPIWISSILSMSIGLFKVVIESDNAMIDTPVIVRP